MSEKRTLEESNDDDQTNETTDVFQQDDKRVQLTPVSDTTLQDLPIELLEDILIRAVVMEVKSLKLAKCVWKEKAGLVMGRLGTVCSYWSNVLKTGYFRNKVHGILESTAQKKYRWEILHQAPIPVFITRVASLRNEVFMLSIPENRESFINVYDRNNLVDVRDVIHLPEVYPVHMVACSVSDCVYMYVLNNASQIYSIVRIAKDEEHQFSIAPWVNELIPYVNGLFTTVSGGLIIVFLDDHSSPYASVGVYAANGSMQHEIMLLQADHEFVDIFGVIQKSNGNLVLAITANNLDTVLEEIDMTGARIRLYRTSMLSNNGVNLADDYRIWISGSYGSEAELLDSEFNRLDSADPPQEDRVFTIARGTQYNSERNEIVCIYDFRVLHCQVPSKVLTIFRFTGE